MFGLALRLQVGAQCPCFLCLWNSRGDDQHIVWQESLLKQGLKHRSHKIQYHPLVEPKKILLSHLTIELGLMKNFVKGLGTQRVCSSPEVVLDEHGETQDWYIWRYSNKRTHEVINLWWSTERSCAVCLAVTEVSSYKIPRRSTECGIREGNWWLTGQFPPHLAQECHWKCIFCCYSWSIYQRTVEISMKSRVSAFIMIIALLKNVTEAGGM